MALFTVRLSELAGRVSVQAYHVGRLASVRRLTLTVALGRLRPPTPIYATITLHRAAEATTAP